MTDTPSVTSAEFVQTKTLNGNAYRCVRVNGFGLKWFEPRSVYTREQILDFPLLEQIEVRHD